MNHYFNVEIARRYGIEEAIIIENLYFWIKKNVANEVNKNDGRYWTYNSAKAFSEIFPYMSARKISRVLASLYEKDAILKGNYNELSIDRTMWYSFTDELISVMDSQKYDVAKISDSYDLTKNDTHLPKMSNGNTKNDEPIPYSNPYNNQQIKEEKDKSFSKKDENDDVNAWIDEMYSLYPTKCPCRNTYLGKCNKDKERIRKLLKSYTKEQIEKVFRNEIETKYGKSYMSNFSTFLNNFPDPNCIDFGADECNLNEDNDKLVINGVEYR